MKHVLLSAGLILASLLPLLGQADVAGDRSGTLAAVFLPGTPDGDILEAVAMANGLVVRSGGFANVIVAHGEKVGFASRLRHAGAILVLDPLSAAGCLVDTQSADARQTNEEEGRSA